jgi:hypothetical protein
MGLFTKTAAYMGHIDKMLLKTGVLARGTVTDGERDAVPAAVRGGRYLSSRAAAGCPAAPLCFPFWCGSAGSDAVM